MTVRAEAARVRRLKIWIICLSLISAGTALAFGSTRSAAGLITGGLLILFNLIGTEQVVSRFATGNTVTRLAATLVQVSKFGLTALVIAVLLMKSYVSSLGLLLGLTALPAALVFDIFLFPVNKGEIEKEH